MKEPKNSSRKLFNDDQRPTFDPQKYVPNEHDKENNFFNHTKKPMKMQSPIPSVKGTWNQIISPAPVGKFMNIASPNIQADKRVLQPKN